MYDPHDGTQLTPGIGLVDTARRGTSLLDQVLGWLALSLLITTAGVYAAIAIGVAFPWFVYLIAMFGLIFAIQGAVRAGNTPLAATLFAVFAFVEGIFLGPVISYYLRVAPDAVGNAILGTAGIFVGCGAVVWVTNRSFAAWGKWLFGALIVGIVLIIAGIFIPINQLLIDLFLGVVFVGLTLFDFWRVKAQRPGDGALLIALSLYLDFINLFLILLRVFGRRR
ncbi:MAG TPA: Bax inhibitor-1/YccA family protein [Candidatus Dormibacteraeota bacterium]|jgi:FtsH-binding integral membrane protein